MPFGKNKGINSFNIIWTSIVIFIFILIAVSSFFNLGRPGYNRTALLVYGFGAVVGIALSITFGIFGVFNTIKKKMTGTSLPFQAGFVSETSDNLILSKNIFLKFIPHLIWVVVVIFLSLGGFKIWAEPDLYSGLSEFGTADNVALATEQFGIARSIWDVGVMPAFTEDMASVGLASVIIMFLLLLVWGLGKITKLAIFKLNAFWNTLAILIACPISAFGLGFIPGFAQAHTIVGGSNIAFIFATFAFQTINLYVMFFTGFFFPLAHLVHNSIFVLGFAVAFSIAFMLVPIIKKHKNKMEVH